MSDELAQDEEDAEDYDLEAIQSRDSVRHRDDDEATLVGGRHGGTMQDDAVVFEIGDEDAHDLSDEEDDPHKRNGVASEHHQEDHEDERAGLISGDGSRKNRDD
ncbi:hypothetical protein BV25DRAFT_1792966 [Artomyces pyxidatus]|uniref:Uncharacterized protein n=1 Tax=Artomyces pyxidatus TaxID=48021 RepID=A0ACB8TI49_9AGAM|nr:hypothetical protein BV25DRAFT_1792966 [Artomyces pyxidatus]